MFVYKIYLHAILFLNKMLPMTFDAFYYAATYKKVSQTFFLVLLLHSHTIVVITIAQQEVFGG